MTFAQAHVSLLLAADDPSIASGTLHAAFSNFRRFLRISGITTTTPMFYHDGIPDAGGFLGDYIIPLTQASQPPVGIIVSAWLDGQPERAVQLSVGESEAVVRSPAEAERFLRHAQRLREKPESPTLVRN